MPSKAPDLHEVRSRFLSLVEQAGLEQPDVAVIAGEQVLALWFERKLAVVIDEDGTQQQPADEVLGLYIGLFSRIGWICAEGGFPYPDRLVFDRPPDQRPTTVTFVWTADGFDASWEIDEFLGSALPVGADQLKPGGEEPM